ncbi:hypothetical protein [Brevundimonas goettingensis]|uniref:Uncharacterized protein n=1 Tax=Brevundimonas goettingensis TaxID=2774190 RepID=A0A975C1W5_9CAUL|nr:hypothetical protein [Brevundimonas goettingensis]QTC92373.1 hypothetical protein IFJ75_05650 [Brevundimonas goettingensis]
MAGAALAQTAPLDTVTTTTTTVTTSQVSNRKPIGCEVGGRGLLGVNAFRQGDLPARECAIQLLEQDTAPTPQASYATTRSHVSLLHGFYIRRAERQQTFMDLGAAITVVGAAGAFEGGISDSTRTAWTITAIVPSVISRFNAYEPTRELFHGGALATQLITYRYDRFNRLLSLSTLAPPIDCTGIGTVSKDIVAKRASLGIDPNGVVLQEVQRLEKSCGEMKRRNDAITYSTNYASRLAGMMAQDYAGDILLLDQALVARDRDLRYTPFETLTAIVASPLRAADLLLTGEDTKAAIDSLKITIAFSGLNRNLAQITLPPLPAAPAGGAVTPSLSAAAAGLGGKGTADPLSVIVIDAQREGDQISAWQDQTAFRETLATQLIGVAGANYLSFTYDAATSTTVVALGPPPQTSPIATATTANKP